MSILKEFSYSIMITMNNIKKKSIAKINRSNIFYLARDARLEMKYVREKKKIGTDRFLFPT